MKKIYVSGLCVFAVCFSIIARPLSKDVTLAQVAKTQVAKTQTAKTQTAKTQAAKTRRDVSLHLKGSLPSAKTPARAYLFPSPAGIAGTLAWTIAQDSPKSRPPDVGLYVARMGAEGDRMPRRFDFRVAGTLDRAKYEWQQGEARELSIAPNGQSVIYGSEPETFAQYSPDFFIEVSALSELDLTTGKSRVLIDEKASRSDFSWSRDGRFLSYRVAGWRFPYEQAGGGLSFEMSYPPAVLDLQTLQLTDEKQVANSEQEFGRETQWTGGERTVRVEVERDEYSEPGERRSAQVTISNRLSGAEQGTFQLQGQLVEKTRPHKARQIIEPLGLSPDGRYLFVRYGESDASENQNRPLQITDQGVFAVDLDERHARLMASFKLVAEVAWRAK